MRKILIRVSKFSLLSQFRHGDQGHKAKGIRSPFSSIMPDDSISRFISKDSSTSLQHKDSMHPDLADASPPTIPVPKRGSHVGISMSNAGQKNLYISPQKYIMKDLICFLAVEKPVTRDRISPAYSDDIWVGSGSISGFDMTISLYEINVSFL